MYLVYPTELVELEDAGLHVVAEAPDGLRVRVVLVRVLGSIERDAIGLVGVMQQVDGRRARPLTRRAATLVVDLAALLGLVRIVDAPRLLAANRLFGFGARRESFVDQPKTFRFLFHTHTQ